jgi:hypothetical protein
MLLVHFARRVRSSRAEFQTQKVVYAARAGTGVAPVFLGIFEDFEPISPVQRSQPLQIRSGKSKLIRNLGLLGGKIEFSSFSGGRASRAPDAQVLRAS